VLRFDTLEDSAKPTRPFKWVQSIPLNVVVVLFTACPVSYYLGGGRCDIRAGASANQIAMPEMVRFGLAGFGTQRSWANVWERRESEMISAEKRKKPSLVAFHHVTAPARDLSGNDVFGPVGGPMLGRGRR